MYKGYIKEYPTEIVEKMLYYQEQQGNVRNLCVFENIKNPLRSEGGFSWSDTPEGVKFWNDITINRNFDTFFKLYPKNSIVFKEGEPYLVKCETQSESQTVLDYIYKKINKPSLILTTHWPLVLVDETSIVNIFQTIQERFHHLQIISFSKFFC